MAANDYEKYQQEAMDFPAASDLRQAFENHFNVPMIFKRSLKSWKFVPWTSKELSDCYGHVSLQFRLVSKASNNISWEGSAEYIEATIDQFIEWHNAESSIQNTNPFCNFKAQDFWAYSSYNYINKVFEEDASILKAVNWSKFGYPEIPPEDTAFWIGSEGSYTPCHFDTYGFNLVAQIQGRKKWTLFPPDDTHFMYPTRIPYEESSVYSSVNILNPNFKSHPLFKFSHPHVLILEPGDVLYVPNKWWHFVQSLDATVSINSWIKLDSDKNTHLEEGVTRALMSSFISYFEPVGESWLNVGEELVLPEVALSYITTALSKIKNSTPRSGSAVTDSIYQVEKTIKVIPESDVHSNFADNENLSFLSHNDIKCAVPESFSEWYGKIVDIPIANSSQEINMKNIIDCLVHPDVISVICKLLKNT